MCEMRLGLYQSRDMHLGSQFPEDKGIRRKRGRRERHKALQAGEAPGGSAGEGQVW